MNKDNLLSLAVLTWGEPAQILMAIEEMSELTKALCKWFRSDEAAEPLVRESILEEIADVKITVAQMEIIFGSADGHEEKKLARLEERINAAIARKAVQKGG